ncbi:phosphopeptide-binding protein [Cryomorpha ignava]|uniref:Phosphopeptide-binding protein n=1 Tax=Cryomorpha ignava TaxID=101383 RepID=A0A7K3WPR9_9FLAO|nr:phosphopeptide-binding protein [Cryomorpha ignava]NEN22755.1 phosphopeptide-binding protein [Cryomorpha ignava]
MKSKLGVLAIVSFLALSACTGGGENTEGTESDKMVQDTTSNDVIQEEMGSADVMEKDGIKVSAYTASPEFAGAKLTLKSPKNGENLKAGNVKFDYNVEGYELGAQTSDAETNGLANSDKGQHIHAILNNEPYMAEYLPGFEKDLKGGKYVLLSFLSRSYHESVKNPEAMSIIEFNVGNSDAQSIDLNAPHLFYSRPKGSYKGEDTNKLLLDFYLVNANLSTDGYKVRATLNGTEFMLTNWSAYVVEGLPKGDVEVKLELLDANGASVNSPYNPSTRTVTLEE